MLKLAYHVKTLVTWKEQSSKLSDEAHFIVASLGELHQKDDCCKCAPRDEKLFPMT